MDIVLINPQIPQNTGNIARTCAATGSALHLVKPLGFSTDNKSLKRAGLDYWDLLDVFYYENIDDFLEKSGAADMFFFTTKARRTHTEIEYTKNSRLVFGSETAGLPEELLIRYPEQCCRIPMIDQSRSLNLSNSAAIAVYEAMRQTDFFGLNREGHLHRLSWQNKKNKEN